MRKGGGAALHRRGLSWLADVSACPLRPIERIEIRGTGNVGMEFLAPVMGLESPITDRP